MLITTIIKIIGSILIGLILLILVVFLLGLIDKIKKDIALKIINSTSYIIGRLLTIELTLIIILIIYNTIIYIISA